MFNRDSLKLITTLLVIIPILSIDLFAQQDQATPPQERELPIFWTTEYRRQFDVYRGSFQSGNWRNTAYIKSNL